MIKFKSINILAIPKFKSKSKYMFTSGHFHVLRIGKTRKHISCVAIGNLERKVRKASHCGSKQK